MHGADDSDDRPPPAKSARTRPPSLQQPHGGRPTTARARRPIDPRFDPMYSTPDDLKQYEKNYKFLLEQEEAEEEARRFRIKCLKCVIRRHEMEQARYEKKKQEAARAGKRSRKAADDDEDDEDDDEGFSDYEREVFGDDHLRELAQLKLTPPQHLYRELEQLQRQSQLYVSRKKNTAAVSRRSQIRKRMMKEEVSAVKGGTKAKPFFPKRSVVKRAVLSDTFDRLEEKGSKSAVDRYIARKTHK